MMALAPRQVVFYREVVRVFRPTESLLPSGRPADPPVTGTIAAAGVPCHFDTSPSQFELQDLILSEGDNIFTLDKVSFDASQDLRPDDVVQVTAGHALLAGGYWKLRGALKPKVWRANKQEFVAARLSAPPAWVASLVA